MGEKVSVVIPCQNCAAYLPQAIDCVLAQNADEIIVVDDGSTDASAEIAASYGGVVRVLRQTAKGISGARNTGIKAASHGYIGFLDADDLWTEGSLKMRYGVLEERLEIAGVYGHSAQFLSPDIDWSAGAPPLAARRAVRLAGSLLLRREAIAKSGLFNENIAVGETFDFVARLSDAGQALACVPDIVLMRRIHEDNFMRSDAGKPKFYLPVLKAMLDRRRASLQPAEEKR